MASAYPFVFVRMASASAGVAALPRINSFFAPASSVLCRMVYSTFRMKTCLLAITGSVAALKTPELVRALQKYGFDVHAVLTPAAREFVAPGALAAVTGNPVLDNAFFSGKQPAGVLAAPDYAHLAWAKQADLILVAPASADTIARIAHGRANGVFEAAILAAKCPVLIAPAMNTGMLEAQATQANIDILRSRGIEILKTSSGVLACGDEGAGRLLDAESISLHAKRAITPQSLSGKKVLITLGGTREPLDPVRFLGNASSGKMGIALAKAAFYRGAAVHLIAGEVAVAIPEVFAGVTQAQTAQAMLQAAQKSAPQMDICVFAAAVADFAPANASPKKLESGETPHLKLQKNPDIAFELGKHKQQGQKFLGFALETGDEKTALEKAKAKLEKKNLDAIFLNFSDSIGSELTQGMLCRGQDAPAMLAGTKEQIAEILMEAF